VHGHAAGEVLGVVAAVLDRVEAIAGRVEAIAGTATWTESVRPK